MSKSLIGIIGLVVAIISVYFGCQQYQLSQEMKIESQPEVVVCLHSLFYERSNTVGSGDDASSVPKGQVSFRLANTGGTQVTVSKVAVNPVGTPSGVYASLIWIFTLGRCLHLSFACEMSNGLMSIASIDLDTSPMAAVQYPVPQAISRTV